MPSQQKNYLKIKNIFSWRAALTISGQFISITPPPPPRKLVNIIDQGKCRVFLSDALVSQ